MGNAFYKAWNSPLPQSQGRPPVNQELPRSAGGANDGMLWKGVHDSAIDPRIQRANGAVDNGYKEDGCFSPALPHRSGANDGWLGYTGQYSIDPRVQRANGAVDNG